MHCATFDTKPFPRQGQPKNPALTKRADARREVFSTTWHPAWKYAVRYVKAIDDSCHIVDTTYLHDVKSVMQRRSVSQGQHGQENKEKKKKH